MNNLPLVEIREKASVDWLTFKRENHSLLVGVDEELLRLTFLMGWAQGRSNGLDEASKSYNLILNKIAPKGGGS